MTSYLIDRANQEFWRLWKTGHTSEAIKLKKIRAEDISCGIIKAELERLSQLDFGAKEGNNLLEALARGMVCIAKRGVALLDVGYGPFSEEPYLMHRGIISLAPWGLTGFGKYGVFGSPDAKMPTYLTPKSMMGEQESAPGLDAEVKTAYIWVISKELSERRSIFADPKTIHSPGSEADAGPLCSRYFVLGGIPKEAIKSIRIMR